MVFYGASDHEVKSLDYFEESFDGTRSQRRSGKRE